jgi:hypothetical protein
MLLSFTISRLPAAAPLLGLLLLALLRVTRS